MGDVSVTIQSLKKVKSALSEFQTKVDDVTAHASCHGEGVVAGVRESLKKQRFVVEELKRKKERLKTGIEECENSIVRISKFIQTNRIELQTADDQINDIRQQIAYLYEQKSRTSSGNDDQDEYDPTEALEQQIRALERQMSQLQEKKRSIEKSVSRAEESLSQMKNRKGELETDLNITRRELEKAEDKEARMKSSANDIERHVQKLNADIQNFRNHAITTGTSNLSGIEKCIRYIEEYEKLNIS